MAQIVGEITVTLSAKRVWRWQAMPDDWELVAPTLPAGLMALWFWLRPIAIGVT